MFRRYMKKQAISKEFYQYVAEHPLQYQGSLLAHALGIPDQIGNTEYVQCALMLLVNSKNLIQCGKVKRNASQIMGRSLD